MDQMGNNSDQQNSSQEAESCSRPSLSQVKMSWGFRRSTIARREFMEEVGDLAHSPPLVRKGRSRRSNQTVLNTLETCDNNGRQNTPATRSVIDDLEWSAPSSPVSEENKPTSESFSGGSLDPSLWQDFGSAFHTAFSLLGGGEGFSLEMPGTPAVPDIVEAPIAIKPHLPQVKDESEIPNNTKSPEDMETAHSIPPDFVAGRESDDVVLVSSQEDDSDDVTLIQIKEQLVSKISQGKTTARGVKGGRGRGRKKGRGRRKGKGRGRGRGRARAVGLQSNIIDDEEDEDEVMIVNPSEQQQEEEKLNDADTPVEIQASPAHSVICLSPAQPSSDCIYIESVFEQITDATPGRFDDAPEEEEEKKETTDEEHPGILDSKCYDPNALYCICRQKHNDRFMICCEGCQDWFHGSCVGISDAEGLEMERRGEDYLCPTCTSKRQSEIQPEVQPEPEFSFHECLTQSPPSEEIKGQGHQRAVEEPETVAEEKEKDSPLIKSEPEGEMKKDSGLPLCIGPGCTKEALPESVYCSTDCILQHAAATMKTLSVPKVSKNGRESQRKPASARSTAKGQPLSGGLAVKVEEENEMKKDDGGQKEATSSSSCDPSLTDQATSLPSSKLCTASKMDTKDVEAVTEDAMPSNQSPDHCSANAASSYQSSNGPDMPQTSSTEKPKEAISSIVPKQESVDSNPYVPPNPEKPSTSSQMPCTDVPRHHETGALIVSKTSYVIPKKQSLPQPGQVPASSSGQKPSSAQTLLNEPRKLLVPPAPSAPSSRPSQPNNQVRQSIQRSLTGILFKRVCDCEDLEMSEPEVTKLVASIEMEMFDIFRNTDSKYMNKYRTIMFNLKDTRNKGLLYGVVQGEISPFRLVRMTQKDMQAIKPSESIAKQTAQVKETADILTSFMPKPEAVKVDLPSLNPPASGRSTEQKKSLPAPALKARTTQPSHSSAVPDILTCMLKDTTSEHKTHLFDLKCRICTGQISADDEEPSKKKPRVSETRDKNNPSWRKSAENEAPFHAPPKSRDVDSSALTLMDTTPHLSIDSPVLTIVESPASPTMDSPASPLLESPASPDMDCRASPTPIDPRTTIKKNVCTPVVIPAVSTVTITRRDPRTAAARFSALSTSQNQIVSYAPLKDTRLAPSTVPGFSQPPTKTPPKSILMKPSSSADPRLYSSFSRTLTSELPTVDETTQFLAKQEILWKGFLNMLSVAKFVSKGYLVSGSAENLKTDLPDTIQIGGRIMPETVWDYVAKLKTSVTKELCVIRFHPATEEEEVAYVSLFSYFSSRGRFGVVATGNRSIKDLYLVPLSAKESVPAILEPLEGPGLETKRPNLLLGLAIIQKLKRPGNLPLETEEKRPKVHLPKDPMWIPKPPVLYGSDKLEIFKPYDPETPASTTPPTSPSSPRSPSASSSSGTVTVPSYLTPIGAKSTVVPSATPANQSTSGSISEENSITPSAEKTPLQIILNSLHGNKQTDSMVSVGESSSSGVKRPSVFSQVSGPIVDPIVQQYGQKSKIRKIQEDEENDFDRPYDPEEEYDPVIGYGLVIPQSTEKNEGDGAAVSHSVDDDVAYDPEDETIFADISDTVAKPPVQTQISDSSLCPTQVSTQTITSTSHSNTVQNSSGGITQNLPTGTVVVSAATLTEQQRMLEELNKQIEEQKQQLKEQEEALRQQREAVGMFMAHFSVSDTLMSPPTKSLPLSHLSSMQSGKMQTEIKPLESTDKRSSLTVTADSSVADIQTVNVEDTAITANLKNDTDTLIEQDETKKTGKESERYSSAGEIEDSDVAYDPEDESFFTEIQGDAFQQGSEKTRDRSLSRIRASSSQKGTPEKSHRSRKRRLSPKRRSHHERGRQRSPSRKSQRRSPSQSQRRRERDKHRRGERDRSRHRSRNHSERQSRHRKEHTVHRHSHGRRSSVIQKDHMSLTPEPQTKPIPEEEKSLTSEAIKKDLDEQHLKCNLENPNEGCFTFSHEHLNKVKLEISEQLTSEELKKDSLSDPDDTGRSSTSQINEPSQQEIHIDPKIDSTVPLREIDPPIRDSPESPDPEPQFVKPSSEENGDNANIEKMQDPEMLTGNQVTLSNIICSTFQVSVSSVRSFGFRDLHQQDSVLRDQDITEADKKIGENLVLKNVEILSKQGIYSNPSTCFDIHSSRPEIDLVTKHPELCNSGPGIRNAELDIKEHLGTAHQTFSKETGIQFPGSDARAPGVQCKSSGISLLVPQIQNIQGTDMNEAGTHPGTNPNGGPDVMKIGRDQYFVGAQFENKTTDMGVRYQNGKSESPNTSESLSSLMTRGYVTDSSSGRVQMHSRQGGSLVLEESRPQQMDLQQYGRNVNQCNRTGRDIPMTVPGSNINFENSGTNMSCIGPDDGTEYSVFGPDIIQSQYMGPGDMDNMFSSKAQLNRIDSHARGSGKEMSLIKGTADMQGQTIQGLQLERTNKDFGQHVMKSDWSSNESAIQNDWRGLDRRGTNVVRGGYFNHDDRRGHQPDRRGQHIEDLNYDRSGLTGPDFMVSGPGMEVPVHDRRGPDGLEFRRADPEMGGPNNDNQRPGIRGPEGAGLESRHLPGEGPGPHKRIPTGPVFRGPWPDRQGPIGPHFSDRLPEQRGLAMERHGPSEQGTEDPNSRGPGPQRGGPGARGLSMDGPGPDRKGHEGPDFSRPGQCRTDLSIDDPGPDRKGFGDPGFRGPRPERRGPAMDVPGRERRGTRNPDLRGPCLDSRGPLMGGLRPDRRGPWGLDVRGPQTDWCNTPVGGPGPHRSILGDPDFRTTMGGLGPDRVESAGPNSMRPELGMRDQVIGSLGPDRRALGAQNLSGPEPDRGECDWRGPLLHNQGPARTGPGNKITCGLNPDKGGPRIRGPRPDFVRQESKKAGPVPYTRGPGRPQFRDCDQESGYQNMEAIGTVGRDPNIRGPRPDSGMEGSESIRTGRGHPNMRRSGLLHSVQIREGPMPDSRGPDNSNFREPRLERRPQEMEETDSRSFAGGAHFRGSDPERISPEMDVPHSNRRGIDLRGARPAMEGHAPHRKVLRGPDFRGPECENRATDFREEPYRQELGGAGIRDIGQERRGPDIEHLGPDWRRSGGLGPGIRQKGPSAKDQRPKHDHWEGADFGRSELIQRSPDSEGSRPERTDQSLRGPEPLRRNIRGSLLDMGSSNHRDRWKGRDFMVSRPDRTGTHIQEQWSDESGPNMEAVENEREYSGNPWKQHGDRTSRHTFEGTDEQDQQNSGQAPPVEWRPSRWRGGDSFRGVRNPCNRGRGYDRNPKMRDPGSDMRVRPDMGNDCRQSDFRGNIRGSNREGPQTRSRADMKELAPDNSGARHGPGRWNTNIDSSGSEPRGCDPALPHLNRPRQGPRFQGPSDPHSTPSIGPLGPAQDSAGNPCPNINNQNQQALQPQRHRGALLPTPTGVIPFPNSMLKNPNGFSPNRKCAGNSKGRGRARGRGRLASRDRE